MKYVSYFNVVSVRVGATIFSLDYLLISDWARETVKRSLAFVFYYVS